MFSKLFTLISVMAVSSSVFADYPVSRSFSCSTVNPLYSSLDSNLNARTNYNDNDVRFDTVFTFKFRSTCDQVVSQLQARCAYQYDCGVLFCEPQNASYTSLDSTLYQIRAENRHLVAVPVQTFSLMSECLQNAH